MIDNDLGQRLITLYQDPQFFACFTGMRTFQHALKLEKNITVSQKDLYHLFYRHNPSYVSQIRTQHKFERRSYEGSVHG